MLRIQHFFRIGALSLALIASNFAAAKTPNDQLIIGMSMNNLLSLDPAAATSNDSLLIDVNFYDSLVELDPKNPSKVLPGVAESWTIAPDGKTITFKLRKGIKFHSGNPLTADDVVWSLWRILKLNLAPASTWKTNGYSTQNVEQLVRAIDPYTLEITVPPVAEAKLMLLTLGASISGHILDRKRVMEHDKNGDLGSMWLNTNEAGSGPFTLTEWRAKDALLMNRFDGYWRGPAKMKRVIMRHITESQSLRLMLERGDLDLATGLSVPDVEAMKQNKDIAIQAVKRGNVYYLASSLKDPKFADKRVRLALRSLIDYKGINDTVMPNYGIYHQRPVQSGLPSTLPNPGFKLDIPTAKKLLAEAGFPNGFKTSIRVLSDPPFINIATSIQATLAMAGIEASIIPGTGNQVYGAMRERNFELIVGRGGGGAEPHPHANLRYLAYNPDNRDEAKLTDFQGWRTGFSSPEMNDLIEKAVVENNEQKQTAMYQQVQKLYESQVAPILPISQMVDTVVLNKSVRNYIGHPAATTRLREVSKQQ